MKLSNKIRSFLWGVGSLGNIFGGYVDLSKYTERSDYDALMSDWEAVGDDMRKVMDSLPLKTKC